MTTSSTRRTRAPSCGPATPFTFPSLPELARHRTTICPGKLILCQFCHLEVPQEGDPLDPLLGSRDGVIGTDGS